MIYQLISRGGMLAATIYAINWLGTAAVAKLNAVSAAVGAAL